MVENVPAVTGVPSPRIGGGNDGMAWSGGPHCMSRQPSCPSSTMTRRLTGFKSVNMVEGTATKGIPEDRRIGPDEKTSKITLTSWVNSV
jgi:hypothetical protein